MINRLRNLLPRRPAPPVPVAAIPDGERVYAVGDIHGRLDLFLAMIKLIERDDASGAAAQTTVVLLGDLVDRGKDSRGVLSAARDWQRQRSVRILFGNHEEMFLESLQNEDVFKHFLRHGGRETALSYGVDKDSFHMAELDQARAMWCAAVEQDDIAFIKSFEDAIVIGDYAFVHAGIQPDVPLAQQRPRDLRWIREPFLSHTQPHSHVVVHGHTITEAPVDQGNRIGLDTGAYLSGTLTAVALEGTSRRYLEVSNKQQAA